MNRATATLVCTVLSTLLSMAGAMADTPETADPETVIRKLVQANVEKDMATMSRLMAHDGDLTSYSVGGRKYVGWPAFEQEMREEFAAVQKFEIPIRELTVWHKGNIAWFTMELDYTRYTKEGAELKRMILPLRETGVLEQRNGQWVMLSFHESFRSAQMNGPLAQSSASSSQQLRVSNPGISIMPDVSGDWDILEVEDDKRYKATLDKNGNGPYTQHQGRFVTTKIEHRLWQGTWHQPGNDREGGFEVLLSEDGNEAKGIWWYTRVDTRKNIPPKEHGGTYHWKKITPSPVSTQ
ncbi:MAG: nuclear transport factor 2 family protein [Nitrospira sp.]|nr:nuclear transport factor 2 family protein [Nitrospira sp.]